MIAFGLLLVAPVPAVAQDAASRPTLSGSWTASALAEAWAIGDWGEACGPKPRPQGAAGGSVQIREQGGELSVVGAGRAWSTAECWEQMPGLARTSHSASGNMRGWRTRCSTPASDPRRATIVTTVSATDSTISMQETGQYQFVIQDTNCTASVTRTRSFSLVRREGEAAPAASESAKPEEPAPVAEPTTPSKAASPAQKRCLSAGEPARLEVRPSRKLLRPGDKFGFAASVLDADGCLLSTKPTWSLGANVDPAKITVDSQGVVAVADDATEGKIELSAAVGGKGVTVQIEIASPANYDALLASTGLNDAGENEDTAVAVIATGSVGGRPTVVDDTARGKRLWFLGIVGGAAICLALTGILLMRRSRVSAKATLPADVVDGEEGEVPPARSSETPRPVAAPTAPRSQRGKICPTCGQHYSADAAFCGKDGTILVLLN